MRRIVAGAVMVASTCMFFEHVGQRRASSPNVRFTRTAHSTYLVRAKSAPPSSRCQCAAVIGVVSPAFASAGATGATARAAATSGAAMHGSDVFSRDGSGVAGDAAMQDSALFTRDGSDVAGDVAVAAGAAAAQRPAATGGAAVHSS